MQISGYIRAASDSLNRALADVQAEATREQSTIGQQISSLQTEQSTLDQQNGIDQAALAQMDDDNEKGTLLASIAQREARIRQISDDISRFEADLNKEMDELRNAESALRNVISQIQTIPG